MKLKHCLFMFILGGLLLPKLALAAPVAGALVKLSCPAGAGANHPCRAVYYVGHDGRRHAFPNQQVYFSWYADWNGVLTVADAEMAALPLGRNVTYRPGVKLVKFPSVPQTYAVDTGGVLRWIKSEAAARALYGDYWNTLIDDISETFYTDYQFGSDINSASDFDTTAVRNASPTIDAAGGSTYSFQTVTTSHGLFDVHVVRLDRVQYQMKTLNAGATDCSNNCPAKSLADLAGLVGASVGINGTYFCPPDYSGCADEINTYNGPLFDSRSRIMFNTSDIPLHIAPMIAETNDGQLVFYSRAPSFGSIGTFEATYGSPLHAAIANYPSLIDHSTIIVESEPRLEEGQRTTKARRGAIGWNQDEYILAIAPSATVVDMAYIMQALGATNAMNLDGGGSSALMYGGTYKLGPGRLLPNAIVFTER